MQETYLRSAQFIDLPPPPKIDVSRGRWKLGLNLVLYDILLGIPLILLCIHCLSLGLEKLGFGELGDRIGVVGLRAIFVTVNTLFVVYWALVLESWEKIRRIRGMRRETEWWRIVGEMLEERRGDLGGDVTLLRDFEDLDGDDIRVGKQVKGIRDSEGESDGQEDEGHKVVFRRISEDIRAIRGLVGMS